MTSEKVPKIISNPSSRETGPPNVCFFLFVFFWRVRPSIRSRWHSRNTVFHFRSALGNRAVSFSIMGAFLVSETFNFDNKMILKPMSKRILPQTTIFKSPRRPKEEKVPKTFPTRSLGGGSSKSLFHPNCGFL